MIERRVCYYGCTDCVRTCMFKAPMFFDSETYSCAERPTHCLYGGEKAHWKYLYSDQED